MTQYDSTNRGVLFKAKEKKSDNSPDYTGSIMITPNMAGKELRLSAWIKQSKQGTNYMSLAVSEQQKTNRSPDETKRQPEFNDDIPF